MHHNNLDEKIQNFISNLNDPIYNIEIETEISHLQSKGILSLKSLMSRCQDDSEQIDLRTRACWLLGRIGSVPEVTDTLLSATYARNTFIRSEAARSLGCLGSKKAVDRLMHMLRTDENAEVKKSSAYALGLIGDVKAIDLLVLILLNEKEESSVRGMIAEALGDLKDEIAVKPLSIVLSDDSVEVRYWAIYALGELGFLEAMPALNKSMMLENENTQFDNNYIKIEINNAIRKIANRNRINPFI